MLLFNPFIINIHRSIWIKQIIQTGLFGVPLRVARIDGSTIPLLSTKRVNRFGACWKVGGIMQSTSPSICRSVTRLPSGLVSIWLKSTTTKKNKTWIFFGATFQRGSIVLPAAIQHPSLLCPSLRRKQTSLPWFQKEITMKRTCNRDHRKKFPHGSTKSRHLLFHLPKSLTLSLSSNHAIPCRGTHDLLQSR